MLARVTALTKSDNASVAIAGAACAGSILRRAGEGRECMGDDAVDVAVKGMSSVFQVRCPEHPYRMLHSYSFFGCLFFCTALFNDVLHFLFSPRRAGTTKRRLRRRWGA